MQSSSFDLFSLRAAIEQSPRNETARGILEYLERGDEKSAKALYNWDGDKIASNKKLQKTVENLLGCRTHNVHNCQNWLCVKLRKSLEEFGE